MIHSADYYFCLGAVYGFFVAGVFGTILSGIRTSRMKMGRKNKPLDAFPDAAHPHLTAAKIYWESSFATCGFIFWLLIGTAAITLLYKLTQYILNNLI